jgi:pimeloyl-ACP methyl ester carboxylesterase
MSAIIVDDQIVHYEVLGRGPALVFVHGWLGSWRYWVPTMQSLSSHYRTYALDLWGFGDSGKKPDRYGLDAQAALLHRFMDQLAIARAAFVGHGLGGAVVTRFAGQHPDLVARVMAVSAPVVGAAINARMEGASPAALLDWLVGRDQSAEHLAVEAVKADWAAVDSSVRALMASDLLEDLSKVQAPCLLVHGERDPAVAPPQDGWFSGLNSTLHRIVLEDSKHFPMLEEVSKFNRLLLDFLETGDLTSLKLKEEWKRRMR